MSSPFLNAYDDHLDRVYGFFAYRLDSRVDAEDLTQLTFERAFRAWDSFDPRKGSTKTWLLAVARNLLIDFSRRDPASFEELTSDDAAHESLAEPATADLDVGLEADLAAALATLSQR